MRITDWISGLIKHCVKSFGLMLRSLLAKGLWLGGQLELVSRLALLGIIVVVDGIREAPM